MFDLDGYFLRKLDIAQGYKPLDFGGGGITGSVNRDGRIIAVNNYHPEHGYVTLTSIPAFPDEDRYDAAKVRAYRRSLVDNEGFGLEFEQEIVEREYYLIEDAVPFMRFTLADGTVAECLTIGNGNDMTQVWEFSREGVKARVSGKIWLQRAAYTQLTEGGVVPFPSVKTSIRLSLEGVVDLQNAAVDAVAFFTIRDSIAEQNDGLVLGDTTLRELEHTYHFSIDALGGSGESSGPHPGWTFDILGKYKQSRMHHENLILSRAKVYGSICSVGNDFHSINTCILTDHMILPLSWNRDAYYVASLFIDSEDRTYQSHLKWLFEDAWRGTYHRQHRKPIASAWARAYMANGRPKDNNAYQLDQQIFPLLEICGWLKYKTEDDSYPTNWDCKTFSALQAILASKADSWKRYSPLFETDETPADDDLAYPCHFSSHILLWHTLRELRKYTRGSERITALLGISLLDPDKLKQHIKANFIAENDGKQIYAYAISQTDFYFYHDANDIPLVMMPIWGFCDKNDPVWRNTVEFAFSDENPGFYDGVLGSVHTPAPWALGDAQELILCKVIGDRDRYARVWERVEKAAQWDGALPEAYDANTFEVVSRHWFAWPNAMIAIADSISWDWEQEAQA